MTTNDYAIRTRFELMQERSAAAGKSSSGKNDYAIRTRFEHIQERSAAAGNSSPDNNDYAKGTLFPQESSASGNSSPGNNDYAKGTLFPQKSSASGNSFSTGEPSDNSVYEHPDLAYENYNALRDLVRIMAREKRICGGDYNYTLGPQQHLLAGLTSGHICHGLASIARSSLDLCSMDVPVGHSANYIMESEYWQALSLEEYLLSLGTTATRRSHPSLDSRVTMMRSHSSMVRRTMSSHPPLYITTMRSYSELDIRAMSSHPPLDDDQITTMRSYYSEQLDSRAMMSSHSPLDDHITTITPLDSTTMSSHSSSLNYSPIITNIPSPPPKRNWFAKIFKRILHK